MRDRVQQLLARQGPMAASDAAAWLNTRPESVYSALRLWRRANPTAWHVSGWRHVGGPGCWGAVFALGPGEDVPKPARPGALRHREYRQRQRTQKAAWAAQIRTLTCPAN